MNPKNPTSREEQEHEDCGRAVYKSWCAACVEGRGVGRQPQAEPLEEEERERTTPMEAFGCGFLTQRMQTRFQFCSVETTDIVKRERRVANGNVPQHTSSPLLVDFIKDLDFRRIILKCDNERSMKVFQEAMIHSCVEVAVRE